MIVQELAAAPSLLMFTLISQLKAFSVLYLDYQTKIVSDHDNPHSNETVKHICTHTGSSGSITFENVPPRDEKNRPYFLRVAAVSTDGLRTVIRTRIRPGELQGLIRSTV